MSKRITLEDDEIKLICQLLDRAMGNQTAMSRDLADVAEVTYNRLMSKVNPDPETEASL